MRKDFEQRVIDEQSELSIKIEKLDLFVRGGVYRQLPYQEQLWLSNQLYHMISYDSVLRARIGAFKNGE